MVLLCPAASCAGRGASHPRAHQGRALLMGAFTPARQPWLQPRCLPSLGGTAWSSVPGCARHFPPSHTSAGTKLVWTAHPMQMSQTARSSSSLERLWHLAESRLDANALMKEDWMDECDGRRHFEQAFLIFTFDTPPLPHIGRILHSVATLPFMIPHHRYLVAIIDIYSRKSLHPLCLFLLLNSPLRPMSN
jgi:hypothetical protein